MSAQERHTEALKYKDQQKGKLTEKQYSVYTYLLSKSMYNAQDQEPHYYVYKNSFKVKDACKTLHIVDNTWRNSIKKLIDSHYIKESENKEYYIIHLPAYYSSLHIGLICNLIPYGSVIKNGGIIVMLYSVVYRYFQYAAENHISCDLTISQLAQLFYGDNRRADQMMGIRLMLALFKEFKLIDYALVPEQLPTGQEYMVYRIRNIINKPSAELDAAAAEDKMSITQLVTKLMLQDSQLANCLQ